MYHKTNAFRRRGAAAATVAISGTVLIGFAALAVDMGIFYNTRIEAQRSADAAAMAGAWKLLGDERIKGSAAMPVLVEQSRQAAAQMAGLNYIFRQDPDVDLNQGNSSGGDIVLGRLERPMDRSEPLATDVDPLMFNSISVLVRRDDVRNGPVPFFFGQIFGFQNKNMSARAVATAQNRIAGFRVTDLSGNSKLLPFALHVNAWNNLLNGTWGSGDKYSYNKDTNTVSRGRDDLDELNIYPGGGDEPLKADLLPPGNFGTVDIGASNNSTADLSRQIRYGITAEDLAHHGGELRLENGTLYLNGDTGLSAAIKDDLEAIIGQPRVLPLFIEASGPGENAMYTIVAFVGIRVMDVKLTSSMIKKNVMVQPAVVVDSTAFYDESIEPNQYVWTPPTLVR
jgi:hypothetical protein